MNQRQMQLLFVSLLRTMSFLLIASSAMAQVEYVDPTIGNVSILEEPTHATAYLPNSMVRMYPVRKDGVDDQIQFFPLTIISHRQPELFSIMPGSSGLPAAFDQEKTTPYYYSTRFDESLIQTEFSPAAQAGYFRFTFPHGKPMTTLANRQPGKLETSGSSSISGEEHIYGMTAYVYAEFDKPVTIKLETLKDRNRALVSAHEGKSLDVRYGISFISVQQAKRNLEREIPQWGLETIKTRAEARWNETLGRIEVEGGTEAQRKEFYTALYRCSERMINISEDDRYYSAYDHKVHADPRPFYVDNWLWDTFRALEPLQTLLNPDMQADKIQSYVRMYEQSGIMPTFALTAGPAGIMNGNHAAPWIADAWFKGVRNYDLQTAYEGLRKRSLDSTLLPWELGPKTSLDDFYNAHGYMPCIHPGEKETVPGVHAYERRQCVAVTLENSFDDWNISHLARALDKSDDEALFLKRSENFKNLYRQDKSMFWPKDADGNWIEPFDPSWDGGPGGRDYYDENNGYTYQWDDNQDFNGLFALMGGRQKAEENLDQLFRAPLPRPRWEFQAKFSDSTSMMGEFSMGNEPSFAIPFIYNRLGVPWKTQKRVRKILESFFHDDLQGSPGDEDGGGMSAFVVFAMMGFYPVTPGIPVYDIGSPVFDKVTIHLKNGKSFVITVRNNSHDNKYVQAVRLNGQLHEGVWFRHSDIANGGSLELTMGDVPNISLGAKPDSFPPDYLTVNPAAYE